MQLWIVLLSFLSTPASLDEQPTSARLQDEAPLRYRGIEQLFAKFEAEADDPAR